MSLKIRINNDFIAKSVTELEKEKEPMGIKVVPQILSEIDTSRSSFKIKVTPPSSKDSTLDSPVSSVQSSPEEFASSSPEENRKWFRGALQVSSKKAAVRGSPSLLEQLRREAFRRAEEQQQVTPSADKTDIADEEVLTESFKSSNLQDLDVPSWDSDFVQNKITSYRSSADFDFIRSLPIDFNDFNHFIGADLWKVELGDLRNSALGLLLEKEGFTIVESLKTYGGNSYCFSLRKAETSKLYFLKILKPKNWDRLSLRNCIYSEQGGTGWLMANKTGLIGVLVPESVIGVNSRGQLTQECEEGSLILATISRKVNGVNLKSLLAQEKIKNTDIPKLVANMLAAVDSFRQKNLIHRDLNPENFLVNLDTLEVTVIDFDQGTTEVGKLKEVGDGGGMYTPPEISVKMDEFTLGLVILEMCTGLNPSDIASGRDSSVKKDVLAGLLPLESIPSDLRVIVPVIEGLLQVDTEKRWSTAHAIEVWQKIMDSEG